MNQKKIFAALVAFGLSAGALFAASSFQNTCSNIEFIYQGNNPAISAMCLKANGTVKSSTLVLQGISNQNGKLVQGSGESNFQQSCGNIQIQVKGPSDVMLTALCRTKSGSSVDSSLPLNNISNQNGNLTQ